MIRVPQPLTALSHPREVVRQFTPQWFVAVMGTGVTAMALTRIGGGVLTPVAQALWLAAAGLFVVFAGLYAARWALYPHEARRIFAHGSMSMFFGAAPMGLAVVINGLLAFGPSILGPAAVPLAHGLWVIDAVLALACGVLVPYLMFTRQDHSLEGMTALWLLPVVATEVAGTTGGLLVPHLADAGARLATLVASWALWVSALPVVMAILTILLLRMALHRLPAAGLEATSWLALGPVATGSLGVQALGDAARPVLVAHGLPELGAAAQGFGVIGGLLFWGVGVWWLALALLITARGRGGAPFGLGWWAYVFPLGVYALATLRLGEALRFEPLRLVGEGLAVVLVGVWAMVAGRTLSGAWAGRLFVAPCIAAGEPVRR